MSTTRPHRTEAELLHNHGHTNAMWAAVTLLLVASLLICVGLFFDWVWLWVVGVVIAVVGVGAGWAMSADRKHAQSDGAAAAASSTRDPAA